MTLQGLSLKEEYRSDGCDLIRDFYVPCLSQATGYDRAVGFFSSTSMAAVARGLTAFVRSQGKMRLIASPCLSAEDAEAIEQGLRQRDEVVSDVLSQALTDELSEVVRNRLACLAWLLAKGILEIRVAVPKQIR
ncbi:MAG: DNA phosphorothioation system restriction enzyme, partial [Cyanobacteria bacterium J06629_9]